MFSSKKIMYFIIMSALLLCFARGIDFMANEMMASMVIETPGFADSGFSKLPEISTLDSNGGNPAVAESSGDNSSAENTTTPTVQTETTTASEPEVTVTTPSDVDVTDPTDIVTEPTDPTLTEPEETTTLAPTTTTTTVPEPTTTMPTIAPVTTTATRTTTRTTTTTTRTTTRTTTTTTTATAYYYNSGSISFTYSEIVMYVGQNATNAVRIPIGGQKRVYFSSKDPSIVSVTAADDTTALITGLSTGTGWIQAISLSGDVCYCKVTVTDYAEEVLRLTNEQRRMYGLPDLLPGTALMDSVARLRLAESQVLFDHYRPNNQKFDSAARELGLDYYRVGENLALGQITPQQVVNAWMNSPTHRQNILDAGFERMSVAYGIASDGVTYWVQFFWQDW